LFRMKCNEAPEEPPTVSEERLLQLSCFINQGEFYSKRKFLVMNLYFLDVKYLLTGLKNVCLLKYKNAFYPFVF